MTAQQKLLFIKLLHTLIWCVFVFFILYVLWSGFSGHLNLLTWVSIGMVLGEALVLLIFRWACPLTLVARRYSDSQRDNFDIFLPEWLAKHNKTIFTTLYAIGVILVFWRLVRG